MALQKHIELDTGIILPEAYIRITEGILSLDRGIMFVTVQTYANKEARDTHKVPVFKREVLSDMSGSKPQINSEYKLVLNNSESGQNLKLVIDLNGDGEMEFELIEGTHITTDGTIGTLTSVVVDKLNGNEDFSLDFIVTSEIEGIISIKAKSDGTRMGSKGNGLVVSGDMLNSFSVEVTGQDKKMSSFEKFFLYDLMNEEGKNLILLAYEFLKSLPEYEGSIDV